MIYFVNMPFAAIHYPSIQLGTLISILAEAGIESRALYPNIAFSKQLPERLYSAFAEHRGNQVGEWLFTHAAFPSHGRAGSYAAELPEDFEFLKTLAGLEEIERVRTTVIPQFVDGLARRIVADAPRAVGLTSTFAQNVASLALARRIKELDPNIITVLGGANLDGDMGKAQFEAFSWIDVAVSGEADDIIVPLAGMIEDREPVRALPGVFSRLNTECSAVTPIRNTFGGNLNTLPVPNYDDYFAELKDAGIKRKDLMRDITLPFEGSRGCWWGEKHHCTFCGLNGKGMAYRQKSADRIQSDIASLADRYGILRLSAVDNIIPNADFSDLCERLKSDGSDYELFYEIKSNIRKDQIKLLAEAGVTNVQPGIESLSSHVLKLMRKGVRAIQNVNTLRWCLYYGVNPSWNVLHGFPGELDDDYAAQTSVFRKIVHLPPPVGGGRIWLERFSPYFNWSDLGYKNVRPERSYQFVYPPGVDLERLAYFFEGEPTDVASAGAISDFDAAIKEWRQSWTEEIRPFLYFIRTPSGITILDGRYSRNDVTEIGYKGAAAALYRLALDKPISRGKLAQQLGIQLQAEIPVDRINPICDRFIERGFMMEEDDDVLALALPLAKSM